jgi:hypothetical protein
VDLLLNYYEIIFGHIEVNLKVNAGLKVKHGEGEENNFAEDGREDILEI